MNCPLCQKKLYAIGEESFEKPIGYLCPTTIYMSTIYNTELKELFKTNISHYDIRGCRTIINLPEDYQIITWCDPLETDGHSTVLRFIKGRGYEKVFSCREMRIDSEEKLLARIKLLTVFS